MFFWIQYLIYFEVQLFENCIYYTIIYCIIFLSYYYIIIHLFRFMILLTKNIIIYKSISHCFIDFHQYVKSAIFLFSIANKYIFIKSLWWYVFIEESHRIKMFGRILKINEKCLYVSERS